MVREFVSSVVICDRASHGLRSPTATKFIALVLEYSKDLDFEIGAHSLRATAATNALDHQADVAKVQEWLGHANISTTRNYLHRKTRPRWRTSSALFFATRKLLLDFVRPPVPSLRSKREGPNLRINRVPCRPLVTHRPRNRLVARRVQFNQMRLTKNIDANGGGFIYDNREVWYAIERLARRIKFSQIPNWDFEVAPFGPRIPRTGLHGDPHYLLRMRPSGNNIHADVINVRTLKTVLREPIQHEAFRKVASDL